jgi:nucleoside-triphosphatase THEP1
MKKNILVTGPPGCGKSTLIERVVGGIKRDATGFFTREIRQRGKRVGFSLETLDGKRGTLAHIDIQSRVRVGKYGVDLQALEAIAVPSLLVSSADTLIVLDEIGKMECFSSHFRAAVLSTLGLSNPVLASIADRGDPFMEGIKAREDVHLHRVLVSNRDLVTATIIDEITELLSSG